VSRIALPRTCLALALLAALHSPACKPDPPVCPPTEDDAGCTGRRWIGVFDPAVTPSCPVDATGIWSTSKLFSGGAVSLPPDLARYCLYTWTGNRIQGSGAAACFPYGPAGPGDAEVDTLQNLPGLVDVGEDCIDVAPLGYQDDVKPWMRKGLEVRAQGVQPLPVPMGNPALPMPVRLVAADTSPDSLVSGIPLGQSRHGDTVAHVARDLACPDGEGQTCAAHLATSLALPLIDGQNPLLTDTVHGGFFGSEGYLAQAIQRAVTQWRDDVLQSAGERRLVINLSVGWENDPERSNCVLPNLATQTEQLTPPARAVLDTLRLAVCHGALVVGAAGNDVGGPNAPSGLVCPARWEQLAAPDAATCLRLTGKSFLDTWNEKFPDTPLRPADPVAADDRVIYAVGGVDQGDAPLVPVRPTARPRLAALGLFGVAWDDSPGATVTPNANGMPPAPPPPLTGTSVAAAVASAIAASVWAYEPKRTAPDVIRAIYQSGALLQQGSTAAVSESGPCLRSQNDCQVRRVALCPALASLGVVDPKTCQDAPPKDAAGNILQNPALPSNLLGVLDQEFASVAASLKNAPDTMPVPRNQLASAAAAPWLFPQPNWPACPACAMKVLDPSTVTVYAKPFETFRDLSLVLVDRAGNVRSVQLAASTVSATAPLRVQVRLPQGVSASSMRKAWISGTVTTPSGGQASLSEQILITSP
jgi:hypothetical protein